VVPVELAYAGAADVARTKEPATFKAVPLKVKLGCATIPDEPFDVKSALVVGVVTLLPNGGAVPKPTGFKNKSMLPLFSTSLLIVRLETLR